MSTYNILTIDGGGLRGIVPVRILQKIEAVTEKKITDIFDLVSGTSTGGLIASCLTIRDEKNPSQPKYNLDQVADIYIKYGNSIFPVKSSIGKFFGKLTNLFSPAYSSSGLDEVLRKHIGGEKIKDSLRPILVSTYDLSGNQPVFFKTSEAMEDETANADVYDVCRATSAAPTFLPAYSFKHKGKMLTGIDGGVYVNNPAMAALAEISRYGKTGFYKKKDGTPVDFSDIRMLSLSTGSYTGTITAKEAVKWGQLSWITKITDIMMRGVNQSTDYESVEMLCDDNDSSRYLRLNLRIEDIAYSDMADAREGTRQYLEQQIEQQITNNIEVMKTLEAFLSRMS